MTYAGRAASVGRGEFEQAAERARGVGVALVEREARPRALLLALARLPVVLVAVLDLGQRPVGDLDPLHVRAELRGDGSEHVRALAREDRAVVRLAARADDLQHAETELHEADGRAAGLEALSDDAERALEQATELKRQIDATDARSRELGDMRVDLSARIAALEERRTRAAEQVAGAEQRRHDAVASLAAYVRGDLLGLALGNREPATARERAVAWDPGDWLQFFAAVTPDALATRGGREHLMNTLDRDYETLRQQVNAGQLQISREHVDGLLVVRGYAHGSEQSLATLRRSTRPERRPPRPCLPDVTRSVRIGSLRDDRLRLHRPIVKELPLEYAIEMNRLIQIHLIQIQMGGSVG